MSAAARNRFKREQRERAEERSWALWPMSRLIEQLQDWEEEGVYHNPRSYGAGVVREIKRRFKAEHELTDADFATDHWQTLFRIQYPEAKRS